MNAVSFTLEEAQEITNYIAEIIDPKHKYTVKKYKRTCAFSSATLMEGKHRTIGLTNGTLNNHSLNGLARVLLHEITHFIHDQRYRNKPYLLYHRRAHRKTFRTLESKMKLKFELVYREALPQHAWEDE